MLSVYTHRAWKGISADLKGSLTLHGIRGHGKPILKIFLAQQDDVTVLDLHSLFTEEY